MKAAWLGLGVMGTPMAQRLRDAGHEITFWNRTRTRADEVAGSAPVVDSPAEAAHGAGVVFVCLPIGAIVEQVLFEDGVVEEIADGGVVVDHSTIAPSDARRLCDRCAEAGIGYLDAPVSGGPPGAAAGTLSVMVGGDSGALERVRPAIESYAAAIVHVGGPGQGQVVKLANNLAVMINTVGVLEAFKLATDNGVEPAVLLDVLQASTADSKMLRTRAPFAGLQPDWPASNDWKPGFAGDLMAKDLDLALDLAAESGSQLDATALVRGLLQRAQDAGLGAEDYSAVWKLLTREV